MNALFDTLGATITGGLILLMIFSAITNMQVLSYNMQQQVILNKISEDLISGRTVNNVDYPGLGYYLSKVGAGVPAATDPIMVAISNSFQFRGQLTPSSSTSIFLITSEAQVNGVYPLYVYLDNMSQPILGPFWLADSLEIAYYDENNTAISNPDSNHDDIRSAKFAFNFTFESYRPDIDKRLVRYPAVIWKYFKNLYL
ncbi:MAG: hypothetical protein Q7J16_04355 [Candidatus Cloacimonadales bacterium]|nr:hypothetical protein [Candidatus Cloacimonadales bacterium]